MFDVIVSYTSKIVIFIGLYFTIFWVLVMLNSIKREQSQIKNWPRVSLIIPAYNEEAGIEKTIKSALALKYPGGLDIIVVNDASKDRTLEIAKRYESIIRIVDKKKNAGKAAAINTALKLVKCEYVGVIDADSEISAGSLRAAIKVFLNKNNDEKVGAVISKMKPTNESGSVLESIQLIEYMMVGLMRALSSSIRLLHLTPGVLSIYKTDLLKSLGGFDSSNMTEDFEAGVKVRKAGYLVQYSYESEVYTTTPNIFKIFLNQRIRWSRGFIQTHKKHKDIFFNKKYGAFGLYQFPMNVFGPIIYFLAIFTISFNIYKKIAELLFKIIYTPDLIEWFYLGSLTEYILKLDPKIDFIIMSSFLLVLTLFYGVIKLYDYEFFKKNPIKKIWAFCLYIMIYNYIYIYVWIISIIREAKNKGYDWGTK